MIVSDEGREKTVYSKRNGEEKIKIGKSREREIEMEKKYKDLLH